MSEPAAASSWRSSLAALLATQQVAYLLVGAANFAMGMGFFTLFHLLFPDLPYMLTLVLAYAAAIPCAFVLYRRFVFKVTGNVLVDFVRFTMVQGLSFLINVVALPLFVSLVGLPVLVGQFLSLCVVVVFNYFAHMLFSFRRRKRVPAR